NRLFKLGALAISVTSRDMRADGSKQWMPRAGLAMRGADGSTHQNARSPFEPVFLPRRSCHPSFMRLWLSSRVDPSSNVHLYPPLDSGSLSPSELRVRLMSAWWR